MSRFTTYRRGRQLRCLAAVSMLAACAVVTAATTCVALEDTVVFPAAAFDGPQFMDDRLPEPGRIDSVRITQRSIVQELPDPCASPPLNVDVEIHLASKDRPEDSYDQQCGTRPALLLDGTTRPAGLCARDVLLPARFCHRPLYFEDAKLERYGYRCGCLQPAASAAHFFGGVLLLPIKLYCQPCCSCVMTPDPLCGAETCGVGCTVVEYDGF